MVDDRLSGLEKRAQAIGNRMELEPWDASSLAIVERDITLTLGQLEEIRTVHARQRQRLLRLECYTDTELMQMEARTPRYSPNRFPEREKFQRRLLSIEQSRVRLELQEAEELRQLRGRLLYLLNEHARLTRKWTSKNSPGN